MHSDYDHAMISDIVCIDELLYYHNADLKAAANVFGGRVARIRLGERIGRDPG